ncbi:MAG: HAD family hydrolase [Capsulimonadaceae bacterium]
MRLEAIFFDVGDTLLFDRPGLEERIWAACRACGLSYLQASLPGALRQAESVVLAEYTRFPADDEDLLIHVSALRLLESLGQPGTAVGALLRALAAEPFERVLFAGALDLIDRLKARGLRIGVVSDWDAGLPELLAGLGVAERLDAMAVSALVGCRKPDPRLFEHARLAAGVDACAVLHVGDYYELDVVGARAAGMQALLFDGHGRRPDADCPRVTTFEELAERLLSLSE